MIENQKIRPAQVIGPLGEPLTLDSLPPATTTRWVVRRKAEVVAAVNALRGERSLAYEARIDLVVACGGPLSAAIQANAEYVRSETLAHSLRCAPLASGAEGPGKQGSAGDEPFVIDFTVAQP